MKAASIFVVIVNFRTGSLVVECLATLAAEITDLRGGRVIVADNASGDNSVAEIENEIRNRGWESWAEVLPLARNGGFAYGNNQAIRRASEHDPSFGAIVCLNPDTTVRRGTVSALVAHLEQHAEAGIAGASIEDVKGELQLSAHYFPSPLTELASGAQLGMITRLVGRLPRGRPKETLPFRCDWVSGACFAVRADVIAKVGWLDDNYFLYFEETDFCRRASLAGFSCWYVPSGRVRHVEGASTGIREPKRRRPSYWFESRRRFFVKSYGTVGLLMADFLWVSGRISLVLRRALGLGGRASRGIEPELFTRDLIVGDLLALARGELRHIGRMAA